MTSEERSCGLLISLDDVHKQYPLGHRVVTALRGVSLDVAPRGFVVIQGPSGSGKTTLLNIIGCLDQPTSGRVRVAGRDVSAMTDAELSHFRALKLGFIFQSFNLIPVLTAHENVEYPLRLNRLPAAAMRQRTLEMLGAVGLTEEARQRPDELSGGQCQRVAIARALVTRPELVIADEPTANLDSATGRSIVSLMKAMKQRYGTTFVVSTHDPAVAALAESRYQLRDGRLGPA